MLEEQSAEHFLKALLPKILPPFPPIHCNYIPHHGKDDLHNSIENKLRLWGTPNTYFIILHDQDNHNCMQLKNKLRRLCEKNSKHEPLIRIVCQELEAWYCGDLDAVQKAFPSFKAAMYKNKGKFRNPDGISEPSTRLKEIIRNFSKGKAARMIPEHMDIHNNRSTSFNCMVTGIQHFVETRLIKQ